MSDLVQAPNLDAVVEQVVVGGDLSKLTPRDRLNYYNAICKSVGLNPLTRPFDYLHLSGKLVLYAKRDATDQLRKLHGVSIIPPLERETLEGLYIVTANARDKEGRIDSAIGAVSIENLRGEAKANAIMKCETKAKRRVTLSICGLGMLDETEAGSIPDARPVKIDYETGEVIEEAARLTDTAPAKVVSAVVDAASPPVAHIGGGPMVAEDAEDAPLNEELERSLLLAKIKGVADKLLWKADKRAAAWDTYCHGMDPRTATLEALNDLYAYFVAQQK